MQDDTPGEIEPTDHPVDLATPYEPPAIVWREKFPVRSIIGMSNVSGTVECGGGPTGYEG